MGKGRKKIEGKKNKKENGEKKQKGKQGKKRKNWENQNKKGENRIYGAGSHSASTIPAFPPTTLSRSQCR